MLKFPDISFYNPNANIEAILKQSGGHLIIRAGYGDHIKDTKFDEFRRRAQAAKAKTLAHYHFVTRHGTVEQNANALIRWVGGKVYPNEYIVLDVEDGSRLGGPGGDWSKSECERYMKIVRDALGCKVLIYANEYYASTGGRRSLFTKDTGWVAKYSSTRPSVPHLIWQSAGTINNVGVGSNITNWPGVGRNGDTNVVFVSEAEFMSKVLGKSSSEGDFLDMADHIYYKGGKQTLKPRQNNTVRFNRTNRKNSKPDVSVAFSNTEIMGNCQLDISGPPGTMFGARFFKVAKKGDSFQRVHNHPDHQFVIPESGRSIVEFTYFDYTNKDERLRVNIYPLASGVEITLNAASVDTYQADR